MRQFLVRTFDKEYRINADSMHIENDYVYFMNGMVEIVAVFYELEYAYELMEGKNTVVYGIMTVEDRYAKLDNLVLEKDN